MMPHAPISCLGLSHRTAPVELRERLHCSVADLSRVLPTGERLLPAVSERFRRVSELTVLSTCHRLELYACVDAGGAEAKGLLIDLLALLHGVAAESFAGYLYYYQGREAAAHLLRVATGLDSLVLGEPQILGQVTDAYIAATDEKANGPMLAALFRAAIRAGKRARTETDISTNPASISSMSVALAQRVMGDLAGRPGLVIGLGQMGQLALKALGARGLSGVAVANRSRPRAELVAARWGGQAYGLDELPQALAGADVVISATSAPQTIIDVGTVAQAMAQRGGRDLVLVDIAVPRDIDPAVRALPGVHLFDVDELQGYLDESLAGRQQEIPQVEAIIAQEVAAFEGQLHELALRPVIVDLRQKAEAIRQSELARTLRHLGDVDPETLAHIQHLSRSLVNKLLHDPTIRLKEKAGDEAAAEYAATIRDLFDLPGLGEG